MRQSGTQTASRNERESERRTDRRTDGQTETERETETDRQTERNNSGRLLYQQKINPEQILLKEELTSAALYSPKGSSASVS